MVINTTDYSADVGDEDLGTELDLIVTKQFHKHYIAGIKFAMFSGEEGASLSTSISITVNARVISHLLP